MDYWDKNITTLSDRFPGLIVSLKRPSIEGRLIQTRSGQPTCLYRGVLLHSRYDPMQEARRRLEGVRLSRFDIFIVFGFGLGYLVEELVRNSPKDSICLVVEPDQEVFSLAITSRNLSSLFTSPRISFLIGMDEECVIRHLDERFDLIENRGIWTIEHPPSMKLHNRYFRSLSQKIQEFIDRKTTQGLTLARFGLTWQRNILRNVDEINKNPGVNTLFGRFKGTPGILVSAGPSLDKNVKELKAAMGKAVIVVVDTALRRIALEGIRVNLVVSVDPQEENKRYFDGVNLDGIFLVCGSIVHPSIAYLPCKKFIYQTRHPLCMWVAQVLGEKGQLDTSGGSVASTAFDLLVKMGCDPVILVGQDLAFTDKIPYTRGADFLRLDELNRFNTLEMMHRASIKERDTRIVEDINGGPIETSNLLYGYLKWFEERISSVPNLIVDATEGGAKKKGTKILPLRDAIRKFCTSRLDEEAFYHIHKNYTPGDKRPFLQKLCELRNRLSALAELAEKRVICLSEGKVAEAEELDCRIKKERDLLTLLNIILYSFTFNQLQEVKKKGNQKVRDVILTHGLIKAIREMENLIKQSQNPIRVETLHLL